MVNIQGLTIGSTVTFLRRDTRKRYVGMVYEFVPPSGISGFGMKNVTVWKMGERSPRNSETIYYFSLREIMELQVIEGANRAITNRDGQSNIAMKDPHPNQLRGSESLRLDPPSE